MEEKDYLGFDYHVEITDKDIAFLLDGLKPSDITAKIDDEELNKISEFYNGKFVCLDFKEFGCKTFGKCYGVKVVAGRFMFLFKHVVDAYDYNLECNEAEDGEFVEVETPYDVYTYFIVSEMGGEIIFDDMDDVKNMLGTMIVGNVREYFWWLETVYAEDYKINPNRYVKNCGMYRLKDENDDFVYDIVYRNAKEGKFEYKSFGPKEYEKINISKNELKDICNFYKGRFVIMTLYGLPHLGRISYMDIKPNTHKVKLFFDVLLVHDEEDGVWTKLVGKDSLKIELGTDFNNWFFNRTVCSTEDIINLMCHYLTQLNQNEMCLRRIAEECGISYDNDELYDEAFEE